VRTAVPLSQLKTTAVTLVLDLLGKKQSNLVERKKRKKEDGF